MEKKYIIKLEENEIAYKTVNSNGRPMIELLHPAPYTEPDLEQIREEVFKNGYDAACKDIDIKSKINAAYRKGLEDAWECARKLVLDTNHGGLTNYEIEEIFGVDEEQTIINYSASECIEKIRQYEQGKEMDGLRQNIQTIVDKCGYSLDEIAEVLEKMKEDAT